MRSSRNKFSLRENYLDVHISKQQDPMRVSLIGSSRKRRETEEGIVRLGGWLFSCIVPCVWLLVVYANETKLPDPLTLFEQTHRLGHYHL